MPPPPIPQLIPFLLLGDAGVGKSALATSLECWPHSTNYRCIDTNGLMFFTKTIQLHGTETTIRINDCPSTDTKISVYMQGVSAVLICCNLNDQDSCLCENMQRWVNQVRKETPISIVGLVGPKEETASVSEATLKEEVLKLRSKDSLIRYGGMMRIGEKDPITLFQSLVEQLIKDQQKEEVRDCTLLRKAYCQHSHYYSFMGRWSIFSFSSSAKPIHEVIAALQEHAQTNPNGASAKTLAEHRTILSRYQNQQPTP